ncbi:DNA polymerase III epsilon subunit-like protein [Bradyrhizobium sp. USDA 4341]
MFHDVIVYDTEASDDDVRHAQVLEFGAAFLDPKSMEEREVVEYDIRLLPYVVPSPAAMAVTGFDPESLTARGRLPEHIAARRIQDTLRPRAGLRGFVGWNTLRFDDELIRCSLLFKNMLDPWICSGPKARRIDGMALSQFVHLVKPEAVLPGRREDGTPTWRLSHVAAANGFPFAAHRATADARATGKIFALCVARAPEAVEAWVRCCDGRRMVELTDPSKTQVLYQFTHFGVPRLEPVMPLSSDRGSVLAAKLDEDLGYLLDKDPEGLAGAMFKPGAPACTFNPKASTPIFTLDEARALGLDCGDSVAHRRRAAELFQADVGGVASAAQMISRRGMPEAVTPEARLYADGMPYQGADRGRAEAFLASADKMAKINIAASFSDIRLREFAARMLVVYDGASSTDFHAAVGEPRGRRLDALGRKALERPHADISAPWETIAKAKADAEPGRDGGYLNWLSARFSSSESEPPMATDEASPAVGQLNFGF